MGGDYWICPGCGKELRVGVKGCPRCAKPQRPKPKKPAKTARHSWEQDAAYDGLDLPDDDFDYDEFTAREFGKAPHRRVPIRWYWWLTAIVLLVFLVWW